MLQAPRIHIWQIKQAQLSTEERRVQTPTGRDESWDCPGGTWRGGLVGAEGRAETLVEKRFVSCGGSFMGRIQGGSRGGGGSPSPSSHWL